MAQSRPKENLKTPEGIYRLYSERRSGLVSFKPERLPKLAVADEVSRQKIYVLHAVAEVVEVCDYGACDKVRPRSKRPPICFSLALPGFWQLAKRNQAEGQQTCLKSQRQLECILQVHETIMS